MRPLVRYLVVGATGHVGSQVARQLASLGHDVTAMVRRSGMVIEDPYAGTIRYVTGELGNGASLRSAMAGMDGVISTANGVVPQNHGGIRICEEASVKRFVQSSVPTYDREEEVPEWLTWEKIAAVIAEKTGRARLRIVPLPAWMPRLNQALARPFSASIANTFALMSFVADHQPRWTPERAIRIFNLPPLMTVSQYLDENYQPRGMGVGR